ncbi:hypothetical protein D9M68_787300 [compost metagenome]
MRAREADLGRDFVDRRLLGNMRPHVRDGGTQSVIERDANAAGDRRRIAARGRGGDGRFEQPLDLLVDVLACRAGGDHQIQHPPTRTPQRIADGHAR